MRSVCFGSMHVFVTMNVYVGQSVLICMCLCFCQCVRVVVGVFVSVCVGVYVRMSAHPWFQECACEWAW